MPITELGFQRLTYDEILQKKEEKARELFGEDIDTSELTPLGKYIRINAYDQALTEEEAEAIYYSIFPNTATGTSLDRLCTFVGLKRNPATYAKFTIEVTGSIGAEIPADFKVGSNDLAITYTITEAKVIEENPTTITVICDEAGEVGNIAADELNIIVNPLADIQSVDNAALVELGKEAESDYSLRLRFAKATQGLGSCNESALIAAILRVEGVEYANLVVDDTAHSFSAYVKGGEDTAIAKAIFSAKPLGVLSTGTESITFEDDYGNTRTVAFSRTTTINTKVECTIITTPEFQNNGQDEIKENLLNYINSLGVHAKLYKSALYGKIYSVSGVQAVSVLTLKKENNGTWSATETIEPDISENCEILPENIEITIQDGEQNG